MLPGIHRIRRQHRGRVYEYWYAWRGGPSILSVSAANERALTAAIAKAAPDAIDKFKGLSEPAADNRTLYGLITRYLVAMEAMKLAARTKRDRRAHLDVARAELGDMEIRALESRRARPFLIAWRDKRAATPKTADDLLGDLSTVFNWAADRGEIQRNPVTDFPRIYSVDRAEIVWEPMHLHLLLAHADPATAAAVELAAATGLRKNDLIRLPWTAIGQNAIVFQTGKSRGRKTIVVPITAHVRDVLDRLPRGDHTTVLASSDGTPWKAPGHGLDSAVRRARMDALEHVRKLQGPKAKSGLEGRRFHDLRGTAATNFILAGVELEDVAVILGWELERVQEIARRYVTAEAIGMGMIARIDGQKRTGRKRRL
ncbi:MAG: hypothetical protein EON96_06285 [Caulobacteraceae bacterium]|nr:MAG: hypothetical protein EON96_06285 [Caulobacteraceae bacterium]